MSLVELTFSPEMATAALEGRKCCTSRDLKKGDPGDEFEIGGVRFRIIAVASNVVENIAVHLYGAEGFGHPSDCVEEIFRIYPEATLHTILHVHFFARCP